MVGNTGGHRRRHSQRLVDATEIVEREPASDSGPVILPLFREGIRQPSESPIAQARAQVTALHNRCTDAIRIGIAKDWDSLHGLHFGGAVPRFAFGAGAIDLDECSIASQPVVQRGSDRRAVRRKAVSGDLELTAWSHCSKRYIVRPRPSFRKVDLPAPEDP